MSSEEKISPEEFDKELDSLLAGTTEKKPKNPNRKKIIIAAAIAILGITGIKLLSGGKDMVPVVDTVTPQNHPKPPHRHRPHLRNRQRRRRLKPPR